MGHFWADNTALIVSVYYGVPSQELHLDSGDGSGLKVRFRGFVEYVRIGQARPCSPRQLHCLEPSGGGRKQVRRHGGQGLGQLLWLFDGTC